MNVERRDVNPNTADRVCTVYVRLPCANLFRNVLGSLVVPFCIVNLGSYTARYHVMQLDLHALR